MRASDAADTSARISKQAAIEALKHLPIVIAAVSHDLNHGRRH
jgi:hypothetical protein